MRPPPRTCPRRPRSRRSTSCCGATSRARRTCRGASGSGIRWCAERSTTPRPEAGGCNAHERCAVALAARGASATARAHHVEYAGRHGDEAAIAVLSEAGNAAIQRTPAGAVRWFGAALRLLPNGAPVEQRVGLLGAQAGALAATGRFEDAHAMLLECVRIAPHPDLVVACAGVEQLLGHLDDAAARLGAALQALPDEVSPHAAALLIELSAVATARLAPEEAHAFGQRALNIARVCDAPTLTAAAAATLAFGAAAGSSVAEADRYRVEAAALIDAMPDETLAERLSAIGELARAELYLDRFEESAAHAERCIAIESARLADNRTALAWALFNRAMTALHAGDIDSALLFAQESADLTREPGGSMLGCFAGLVLGMTEIESGSPDSGANQMIERAGGPDLPLLGGSWKAYFLDWLTGGLLAAGRRAEAEKAAANAADVADATGLRLAAATAARAAARLQLDAGDTDAAAENALAAAEMADELKAPIEAGIARILAGRALIAANEPERAAAALKRAASSFDAIGAPRYRGEAERELGILGHRRYRRSRRQPATNDRLEALTGRELEVARLIVDRRTNAEIAAELYLSVKTVESHIRNLFFKLDVSSRVEVARAIERADRAS
ncbi:MAG TPA: LuxR family transcriptional regulator, partial [Solirubrobacter sp.]|nr:LuxR family transcriptional regulator [Solirubrobacter sp.]